MVITFQDVIRSARKADVDALVSALNPGSALEVRLAALFMLSLPLHFNAGFKQKYLSVISGIAADSSDQLRCFAIYFLGKHGDYSVADVLHGCLRENDQEIRYAATRALIELNCPLSVGHIIKALGESDEDYRREFQGSIYSFGGKSSSISKKYLKRALNDPDPSVRFSAALVLADQGDSRAIEPLLDFLNDENSEVRMTAVFHLTFFDDPEAQAGVISALADPLEEVAIYTIDAIIDSGHDSLVAKARPVLEQIANESDSMDLRVYATKRLEEVNRPVP